MIGEECPVCHEDMDFKDVAQCNTCMRRVCIEHIDAFGICDDCAEAELQGSKEELP